MHSYLGPFALLFKYFYFLDYGSPTKSSSRKRIPVDDADNINTGNDRSDDENILDYSINDFSDNDPQIDNGHNKSLQREQYGAIHVCFRNAYHEHAIIWYM